MFRLKISFVTNEGTVNVEFDKVLPLSKSRILKNLSKTGIPGIALAKLNKCGEAALGYRNGKRVFQIAAASRNSVPVSGGDPVPSTGTA